MDVISDFAVFRAIVEAGGVSAAAEVLQSSPPAVSRRLAALEMRLGVKLAERQSRRFRLTDEGTVLYERSCAVLDQVRDIEAEVASRGGIIRGLLRVGAPTDFGRRHIGPIVAEFASIHDGLEMHLILSDAGLEVAADGCDLVLRFGMPADQGMIARKLATTARALCAAPAYLERFGAPTSPADLAKHNCLRLARRHQLMDVWQFTQGAVEHEVKVGGTLSSASGDVLHGWALSGAGISLEARWDVEEDLASGALVEVLPEYRAKPLELYASFAPGKPLPPRIRHFLDFLLQSLSKIERPAAS
jgi:LysR family transcriptional activator of dmlA